MKNNISIAVFMICNSISLNSYSDNSTFVYNYDVNEIVEPTNIEHFGLNDKNNLITFIKYVKTQSKRLDSEVGRKDVYYVMQTLFNRMKHDNVDWQTYYKYQSINHSHSIQQLKTGHLNPSFSWNDENDQTLIFMLYSALYGFLDKDLTIDEDVLYFHSFGEKYNKSPHNIENFCVEARHRFYRK